VGLQKGERRKEKGERREERGERIRKEKRGKRGSGVHE
jgi:hypothetical protein